MRRPSCSEKNEMSPAFRKNYETLRKSSKVCCRMQEVRKRGLAHPALCQNPTSDVSSFTFPIDRFVL